MSLTDLSMVNTDSYVPVVVSVTTCVCWYVAFIVITLPSFLQVTVVAGPPVEVQVKDLVVSLYTNMFAVGVPATGNYAIDSVSGSNFSASDFMLDIFQRGKYILSPQVQIM